MKCASTLSRSHLLQAGGPPIDLQSPMTPRLVTMTTGRDTRFRASPQHQDHAVAERFAHESIVLAYMGIGAHRAWIELSARSQGARGVEADHLARVVSHAPALTDASLSRQANGVHIDTAAQYAVAELFGYKVLRLIEHGDDVDASSLADQLLEEFAP